MLIHIENRGHNVGPIFTFLLFSNAFMYFECGTVPAMLLQISDSMGLNVATEGLMGGIVYLSLCLGGPIAANFLRRFDHLHSRVIATAVCGNTFLTFFWALTPVGYKWSSAMFISLRFIMGLHQSIICVFFPIWVNEYAPADRKATWFAFMQASVPLGVMGGYIIATIILHQERKYVLGLLSWRIPILIEVSS